MAAVAAPRTADARENGAIRHHRDVGSHHRFRAHARSLNIGPGSSYGGGGAGGGDAIPAPLADCFGLTGYARIVCLDG